MKAKTKKKFIILTLLGLYLSWQILTISSFCYEETRWLNDNELIDRVLFSDTDLTFEEKVIRAKAKGLEYPECCRVESSPIEMTFSGVFYYILFENTYYKAVHIYTHRPNHSEPYYWREEGVNSCGTKTIGGYGFDTNKKSYLYNTAKNYKNYMAALK